MPGELLAGRLQPPGNLLGRMSISFTDEQQAAIERREGEVLLDASAGAGKTSVLVERFVRAVLDEQVPVSAILAITFTDKAAAELRERIRGRLQELGALAQARATEAAQISTIHSFCARLLRAHALQAGLDPAFTVLDAHDARALAHDAFDAALAVIAGEPAGSELIAAHGPTALRTGILTVHDELRARGQRRPSLPQCAADGSGPDQLRTACERTVQAARAAAAELGAIGAPAARVQRALELLAAACELPLDELPWPAELAALALPARNGAGALASAASDAYREQLQTLRSAAERRYAAAMRETLQELLGAYADHYAALKAQRSALDFEDLEIGARELLRSDDLAKQLRARFVRVMVDELQDTNRLQFELIDLVASGDLFMVGDAQQSIYGFRHAEVELFEARGRALEQVGARLSLQTNFRSRSEILDALNAAFTRIIGDRFRPLRAGRTDSPAGEPVVELLIVDKGAEWEADGLASPWRVAEARALARRVRALTDAGTAPGDVVVLTRASTDLRVYERALEDDGVPTYLIGGRGYWSHPQVVALVSYLRALANPCDQEAWYATLCSPLCGISLDGLVLLAADAREQLEDGDRIRLAAFETWFAVERRVAARTGVEELIERVIERTGYDIGLLRAPGGRRRLANVRKLMRLGREWEAAAGPDLHGFLALIERRAHGGADGGAGAGADRESEAPVESEALDAVRLMTIHRAKGLEFDVVCVADLGRGPRYRHDLVRISRDGARLGLRLARAGTDARIPVLDYELIGRERAEREAQEERRLFYVAMTRARERLILSGAAKLDTWSKGNQGAPIDWIAPALVPDIAQRSESRVTDLGVSLILIGEQPAHEPRAAGAAAGAGASPAAAVLPSAAVAPPAATGAAAPSPDGVVSGGPAGPPVSTLSYSALAEYERCGYRYYVERVLGLAVQSSEPDGPAPAAVARGTLVHAVLERIDFRRPLLADASVPASLDARDRRELQKLLRAFAASDTCARLSRATQVRREQRFAFALAPGAPLITGVLDVLAREHDQRALVVDYKSDRLGAGDPEAVVRDRYAGQRLIYAVAALRGGAPAVEVVHLFLEAPERPAARTFTSAELDTLQDELQQRAGGILRGEFEVSAEPQRSLCRGCPAQGGLCSWPRELTSRAAADRLF